MALPLVPDGAWRRRVEPQVPGSTAAHVVSDALTASAAAPALGHGWKGALAVYLPGGMDAGALARSGLYVLFMLFVLFVLNGFGSFIGRPGAVRRRRDRLDRAAGAHGLALDRRGRRAARAGGDGVRDATGLPGFQGIVGPLRLAVAFLGPSFGRSPIAKRDQFRASAR